MTAQLYRVVDTIEHKTISIGDAAEVAAFLKNYFDSCVHDAIDALAKAIAAGNPTCDFESYLGIRVVPFFVNKA